MAAEEEVIHDGHVGKEFNILEGAGNPQIANTMSLHSCNFTIFKDDLTFLGRIDPVDAIEKGSLSGTIGSYDGVDISPIDLKTHIMKGHDAAEAYGKIFYLE